MIGEKAEIKDTSARAVRLYTAELCNGGKTNVLDPLFPSLSESLLRRPVLILSLERLSLRIRRLFSGLAIGRGFSARRCGLLFHPAFRIASWWIVGMVLCR